jgi:hypothetical protein
MLEGPLRNDDVEGTSVIVVQKIAASAPGRNVSSAAIVSNAAVILI